MNGRWMASGVAMVVFLSGCASSQGDEGQAGGTVGVITDPKDLSALNSTGSHVHDYWGGAQALEVVNASLGSSWNTVGGSGYWRRIFTPADETVIPQGTASINVTVRWAGGTPADAYGPVSLWVKPANTVDPRFVQVIESGQTVEVAVLYEEADLPHQLLSGWEFIVQYNVSSMPYSAFFGTTFATATAHRGLALQPFPPHPDQWQGRTELELVDHGEAFMNVGYTGTGNLARVIRAQDGVLVPLDAGRVEVELTLSPGAAPSEVGAVELMFHAADSRAWTMLGTVSGIEGSKSWTIDVEPGMGDGPYGNASLWQFRVYTPGFAPGSPNPTSPAAFVGSFQLTATVHKS